jgi:hypothetical protein
MAGVFWIAYILLLALVRGIHTENANPIQESAVGVGNAGQTPDRADVIILHLGVKVTLISRFL